MEKERFERGDGLSGRPLIYAIWSMLVLASILGVIVDRWAIAFVGLATLVLSAIPVYSARWLNVTLPSGFVAANALFLCGSLVLGEVHGFYERYWWWDFVLHLGSAVGFGLIGVILMLVLVKAHRLSAAPVTAALFAFCFAVMIGTVWEIFEFGMDQLFGLNMQKSGLVDTMWDLIADCLGAGTGAAAGFVYLRGMRGGPLSAMIREFVRKNRRLFGR
jgi:hypothetical protein